jgi:hypothetical protein
MVDSTVSAEAKRQMVDRVKDCLRELCADEAWSVGALVVGGHLGVLGDKINHPLALYVARQTGIRIQMWPQFAFLEEYDAIASLPVCVAAFAEKWEAGEFPELVRPSAAS